MPTISNHYEDPIRLDHLLTSLLEDYSRSEVQRLIQTGDVKIDGKAINSPSHITKYGARIDVPDIREAAKHVFRYIILVQFL